MPLGAVCQGDLLIDFVPTVSGTGLSEAPAFVRAPGGAAANVAVGLARLGIRSAFLGKVGDDPFGRYLASVLEAEGVELRGLRFDAGARTPLAFVSLDALGEREFLFYRDGTADRRFLPAEIDAGLIGEAELYHFDGLSLAADQPRETVHHAAGLARAAGRLVSFDVNFRIDMWPDAARARELMARGMREASLVKLSDDELLMLLGTREPMAARRELWHDGLQALAVTQGPQGATVMTAQAMREVPGFRVEAVDTTGAGDGFMAGLLQGVVGDPAALGDIDRLAAICRFANAAGALTTRVRGAIPALPRRAEVEALLAADADGMATVLGG